MRTITSKEIIETYTKKGYPLNRGRMQLNIFGIRNSDPLANAFDDVVGVIYIDLVGKVVLKVYPATTDPGLYYRENPLNQDGTAIIIPGYYKDCYSTGLHKGEKALIQVAPMKYVRDANKNKVLDFLYKTTGFKVFNQNGRTDIHRAGTKSKLVDKWSAGCQVLSVENDMLELLDIVNRSIYFGNKDLFSYALFELEDFS